MKDHVHESRYVTLEGEVDDVIQEIKRKSEGLIAAYISNESWGGDPDFIINGWRPMTEKELEKAKNVRKREREAKKKRLQAQEEANRALYEKLKTKFEPDF